MRPFLSSNAQDFIEETPTTCQKASSTTFLSSNAQDFIEETDITLVQGDVLVIPEQ